MKNLVSMTSTHGRTPEEVAEELIAAVQKFRDVARTAETDVVGGTPVSHDHDDPGTPGQRRRR